jgi:hypothetical protein
MPSRLPLAYDSEDHLHLNDASQVAMGESVPLELFKRLIASSDDASVAVAATVSAGFDGE